MKRRLLLVVLFFLASTRLASAQSGTNLKWSDCGASGQAMRTFACNTNTGSHTLVGSFVSGVELTQVIGMSAVLDLCSMDPVLPGWWQMGGPATCRPSAISASFDFTASTMSCADYWQGQAQGGMSYTFGANWGFNGARMLIVCAIPPAAASTMDGSVEYYGFRVTIQNHASTGTGACSRCGAGVCLILNSVELEQPAGVGDVIIVDPILSNYVLWQSYVAGCPFIVPTERKSWGLIKSLYR